MPKIPFYKQSFSYATEHEETELYRSSRKTNIECASAINNALNSNYNNNSLNSKAALTEIAKDYDYERITAIVASQIYRNSYDGRYDANCKKWAEQICQTEARFSLQVTEDIHLSSNPGLISILAKRIIEEEKNLTQNKEEFKMNITVKVTPLEREDNLKGLASININGSFAVNSIRIYASENGLFVKMPQDKDYNGEFHDIVFPITKEAREQINNAIIEQYAAVGKIANMSDTEKEAFITEYELATEMGKPASEREQAIYKTIKSDSDTIAPEKCSLNVTLREVNGEHTKAKGQVVINDTIVISNIRVIESDKGSFVAMPSYQNQFGDYQDIAFPITKEAREQLNNAVISKYNSLSAERKGLKLSELGEKDDISYHSLNNKFAEKVMEQLDTEGVKYAAKITDKTLIAVNKADNERFKSAVEKSRPPQERNEEQPEKKNEVPPKKPKR